jgi:phage regulator Rha-like protein
MEPASIHHISKELETKLMEAKGWYEDRQELEDAIRRHPGYAERNQEDRDASDRAAALILLDVVEITEKDWGFGPGVLPRPMP